MLQILYFAKSVKYLPKLMSELESKNWQLRNKLCLYFLLILMTYEPQSIAFDVLETFLKMYLQDAKSEVRLVARVCFIRFKMMVPLNRH